MANKKKDFAFEEVFKKLEGIVTQLESGQETLEKNLELFEEGIKLSEICRTKLDKADQKIKELIKKSDNSFELKELK
ncbi:MAG: exodeoxyribonuclease VII small subunit [Planctomycetia bacterium]|nr:exodeoxyribonuclease VII small subunit [Planctomycetia bacterium]